MVWSRLQTAAVLLQSSRKFARFEHVLNELNFREKKLVLNLIYIAYFQCYGTGTQTGTGKYHAGSSRTGFRWQSPEGHMCYKEPRHGKDGP